MKRLAASVLALLLSATFFSAHADPVVSNLKPYGSQLQGSAGDIITEADWPQDKVAYFLFNNDTGDDTKDCVVYATPGATISPTGHICKTLERGFKVFPKYGNGRSAVWLLAPRSGLATYKKIDTVTDDSLNFIGVSGYNYILRRGSTDLTNSPADRILLGASTAIAGPNGNGSFTVTSGGTVSTFTVAAGSFGSTDAAVGFRWRFDATTATTALRNVSCFINANTSTTLTCGSDLGTAPASGDTGFVERPGVRVSTIKDVDSGVSATPATFTGLSSSIDPNAFYEAVQMAGLAFTSSNSASFQASTTGQASYAFIEGTASTVNPVVGSNTFSVGQMKISEAYQDETGVAQSVGFGIRLSGRITHRSNGITWVRSSAFLRNDILANFHTGVGSVGGGGSYFAGGLQVTAGFSVLNGSLTIVGQEVTASERRTRCLGNGNVALRVFGTGVSIQGVSATGSGSSPALILAGGSYPPATRFNSFSLDDVVGSSGNSNVGVDASGISAGYVLLGATTVNTVTGTLGDMTLPGSVAALHTDFTKTNVTTLDGSRFIGVAGFVVSNSIRLTNKTGSTISPGTVLRSNGTNPQVVLAKADTAANAMGPFCVALTTAANNANVYANCSGGTPYTTFDSTATVGSPVYLSATTAGTLTNTAPPCSGSNQVVRFPPAAATNTTFGYVPWSYQTIAAPAGCSDLASSLAIWDTTLVRYFLLDYDGGNDSNLCYVDAAAGSTIAPAGKACKTIEHLMQVFPRYGNGRLAVWLIKPRAIGATYKRIDGTTDDWIDLAGVGGYAFFLVRGSTDLTNSVHDRLALGAILVVNGPNGDSSYTVTTGATTSVFTIAAGSFGATDALVGYRLRFDASTTTSTIRDTSCLINANTSTTVTCGSNVATAPVNGDTLFIEEPGVRVAAFREVSQGSFLSQSGILKSQSGRGTAGISGTGASGTLSLGSSSGETRYSFMSTTGATSVNALFADAAAPVRIISSYIDETGTARAVGTGIRHTGGCFVLSTSLVQVAQSAFMTTSNQVSFGGSASQIGAGGSYFGGGNVLVINSGTSGESGFSLFGTSSASDRRTRFLGNGSSTVRFQGSTNVFSVDCSNAGATPCFTPGGTSTTATATARPQIVAFDDVVGSTGNTDVCIDIATSTNVRLLLGRTTVNTCTGTAGDIRIAGPVIAAHTDFALTGFVDASNNTLIGSAGLLGPVATLVSNQSGGALVVGNIVRTNGTSGQVTSALADTVAHSTGVIGVMVTSPASTALGYMATHGVQYALYDSAPTAGALVYLSPSTAGKLTTTVPANAGTNQKLWLGYNFSVSGSTGLTAFAPQPVPVTSNGTAP
ncbi:hypothetical protein KW797_00230 [Candidatus Parcubacteria bacterium]|nr:hypothetical protein [Candidatus Parcubacteria bacterium]